jgi:hypothetical protein
VTDNEYGVLLRHANKFCRRAAAGSSKSADHILHREAPFFKIVAMQRAILKIKEGHSLVLTFSMI